MSSLRSILARISQGSVTRRGRMAMVFAQSRRKQLGLVGSGAAFLMLLTGCSTAVFDAEEAKSYPGNVIETGQTTLDGRRWSYVTSDGDLIALPVDCRTSKVLSSTRCFESEDGEIRFTHGRTRHVPLRNEAMTISGERTELNCKPVSFWDDRRFCEPLAGEELDERLESLR